MRPFLYNNYECGDKKKKMIKNKYLVCKYD